MRTSRVMHVSPDAVWKVLEDFGGMAAWSPDLSASAQVEGRGLHPGAIRDLAFKRERRGSNGVRERVVAVGDHWFSYELDGALDPFIGAGSKWAVEPHPKGCRVVVDSHLRADRWWVHLLGWSLLPVLRGGLKRALRGLEKKAQRG